VTSDWKKRELERLEAAIKELKQYQATGQLPPGKLPQTQQWFKVVMEGLLEKEDEERNAGRLQAEPIIAWKRAVVVYDPMDEEALKFHGVGLRATYKAEDVAACLKTYCYPPRGIHRAPNLHCTCGFYALKKNHLGEARKEYYSSIADLEVEFSGKVIVHKKGYRAEYQRVLGVYLDPDCYMGIEKVGCQNPAIGITGNRIDQGLHPSCNIHKQPYFFTPADLSNAFGVEVRWRNGETRTPQDPIVP